MIRRKAPRLVSHTVPHDLILAPISHVASSVPLHGRSPLAASTSVVHVMRLACAAVWLCVSLLRLCGATPSHELRSLPSVGFVSVASALEPPPDIARPSPEPLEEPDADLVSWAASRVHTQHDTQHHDDLAQHPDTDASSVFLLVGVKTSVLHNFGLRQAIRQTWASTRRDATRVFFAGCRPDLSSFTDAHERERMQSAVELERRVYGDLLTTELECVDSYATLVDKTTQFLRWAATSFAPMSPSLAYVVVADDDVFLHMDRLVRLMRAPSTPTRRFYGGLRIAPVEAIRSPSHKNYVSHETYRMKELPQFAAGSTYVFSMDVVSFLVRNLQRWRSIGNLDDVSVGLWLWTTLRIHPTLIRGFYLLRERPCSDDLISLTDVSPSAIRFLHSNMINHRPLCEGLASEKLSKRQRSIVFPNVTLDGVVATTTRGPVHVKWAIVVDTRMRGVTIAVEQTIESASLTLQYSPSSVSHYEGVCVVLTSLLQSRLYISVGSYFCIYNRQLFIKFLEETVHDDPPYGTILALPRHNTLYDASTAQLVVVLSPNAIFARWLIECLLVQMGEPMRFLVINEKDLTATQTPDVVVFSILDDREYNPETGELTIASVYRRRYGRRAKLVMVSGEAWPVSNLDADVLLVSTVMTPHRDRFVYVPFAASVFSETTRHTPLELLHADGNDTTVDSTDGDVVSGGQERRFCAYLYAQCGRRHREAMFDLLNALEPVDALGACQGSSREPIVDRLASRYGAGFFFDEAVEMYRGYKFVVAFENTVAPGYVTEKIVSAFLAGSIPIFYGDSASVRRLFNPRAFINCQDHASLGACARRVVEVHRSEELWSQMRREVAVINMTMFAEAFGWHPVVEEWLRSREPGAMASMAMVSNGFRRHLEDVLPVRVMPS